MNPLNIKRLSLLTILLILVIKVNAQVDSTTFNQQRQQMREQFERQKGLARQQYDDARRKAEAEYAAFRKKANEEYAKAAGHAWTKIGVEPAIPKPKEQSSPTLSLPRLSQSPSLLSRQSHSTSTAQDAAYTPIAMTFNSSYPLWTRKASPRHGSSCHKRNTTAYCTTALSNARHYAYQIGDIFVCLEACADSCSAIIATRLFSYRCTCWRNQAIGYA